jgi:hypothetical protein
MPPTDDSGLYRKTDTPGIEYEHIPGAGGLIVGIPVTLNSFGFRGPETAKEKPDDVTRIAVVGDSIVFGQGVQDDETLPAALESILNRESKSPKYQVMNSGVRGYNIINDSVHVRLKVMPLKPDGIVLGITEINDFELEPFRYGSPWAKKARESFWWKFAPYRVFVSWKALEEYLEASREHIRGLYNPEGEPWAKNIEAIEDIKGQCDESGAWLVVITFPLLENETTFEKERAQLHEKLAEMGIPYVDPKPSLKPHDWKDLVVVPNKDMHPNAFTHGIYAELVYDKLKELGHVD